MTDPDDTTIRPEEWWNTVDEEGPKPYNFKSWTYTLSEEILSETVGTETLERRLITLEVYDSLDSFPGVLSSILQPLGLVSTDPPASSESILTDPDEDSIELTRITTENDDIPPGLLLGSVSYEIFGGTLTITDWEHLNWGDDSPIVLAVKTLLKLVPSNVSDVRVLSLPTAFWTSLGFVPGYKGDPYLHIDR